ncbi:MAG: sporulation protein YqfD, partial [Ruminococcus sp.]|nr:sporulation protein YqfD [Ruminococcus sp.]
MIKKQGIAVRDMQASTDRVRLRVSARHKKRFEASCTREGFEFTITERSAALRVVDFIKKRPGLIAGAVISVLLWSYYSDVVLSIEVQTDNEQLRRNVMDSLKAQGVVPGTYIPDIDFPVVERQVRRQAEGISWAGISRQGSVISVDIMEEITAPKGLGQGMPCDLVSAEDGVIEKLEILDGQVIKGVGCGVVKGDTIVSGTIVTKKSRWENGKEEVTATTRYTRSVGKVYGRFRRVMEFYEPFEQTQKVFTGEEEDMGWIEFFSAQIPVFGQVPEGSFTAEESLSSPTVMGLTMPFGIRRLHLEGYEHHKVTITEDQAKEKAELAAYRYEQNFLGEYDLIDRRAQMSAEDKGVRLRVVYELYGVMSCEREFFAPAKTDKNISEK